MSASLPSSLLAWLLTYLIHSSVLLGVAWLVTRRRRLEPAASDLLWKVALLASLMTGTIQSRLELSTPASVALPVATLPQAALLNQPAAPASDAGNPGVRRAVRDAAGASVSRAPSLPLVVVLVWGAIALGWSLHYVARRLILFGRLADRRAVTDGPLAATLAELQRTAGYRRRVHLTMARTISSPVALGLSEICVPELALSELGAEQQRSMLAHELAHLARRDSLWLVGASLIERFFFFQPLNRLARRELETTAEYLSDEWAMRKTGSAVSLAKCLATVAEWIQASPLGVPVAGLAERRSLLVARIARLLDGRLPQSPASRRGWAVLATLGVAATVAAAPRVSSPPVPLSVPARGDERRPSFSLSRRERGSGGEDTTVVNALIARLKDENADVRHQAVDLLEHLHARPAGSAIARLIHDPSADVRSAVVQALGNLREQSGIAAITEALGDPNADVRQAALGALNDLRAPIAEATLLNLMKDQNADVRQRAAELAGERSVVAAIPQLRRLIDDPRSDVREAATEALGHLADPAARQALQAALQSPDPKVRRAAAEALGQNR